jgi:SAM-dependent methyltransferase
MPTPFDYDRDPDRFRRASRLTRRHLTGTPSLYAHLAELLAEADSQRILDIGCGEGALRDALPAALKTRLVGLDASATMLAGHPPPVVQADAAALPVVTGGVDAAVAVNVLDHLAEGGRRGLPGPRPRRSPPGRHGQPPRLSGAGPPLAAAALRLRRRGRANGLVAAVFARIEVERWDAPMIRLPDRDAVRDYLAARFVAPEDAAAAAHQVATPLTVTKRGALISARR